MALDSTISVIPSGGALSFTLWEPGKKDALRVGTVVIQNDGPARIEVTRTEEHGFLVRFVR